MDIVTELFSSTTDGTTGMMLDMKNLWIILIGLEILVISGEIVIGALLARCFGSGDSESDDYESYSARRKRNEKFAATYDAENNEHGPFKRRGGI